MSTIVRPSTVLVTLEENLAKQTNLKTMAQRRFKRLRCLLGFVLQGQYFGFQQ